MSVVSKTDFLFWRECPRNAWLRTHKPTVFSATPLTDFEQALIDDGIELELLARGLFPSGVLVTTESDSRYARTKELVDSETPVVFQGSFECDGFSAAVDVLTFNSRSGRYSLHEIKSSSAPSDEHLDDVAFQTALLKRSGLSVERAFLILTSSNYIRSGQINLREMFQTVDVTSDVFAREPLVLKQSETARRYLADGSEPPTPCECIFKPRSRHCTTFKYSNPNVPSYGIHDIAGIRPTKVRQLVESGCLTLLEVPKSFELSEIQRRQVDVFQSGKAHVDIDRIRAELLSLRLPIAFLDYETFPSAIPLFDGYSPHEQVPFQYSLHVAANAGDAPSHFEFLYTDRNDPVNEFVASLQRQLPRSGSIVVWNKSFECGINESIWRRAETHQPFLSELNSRVYDLRDVFSKQFYVHPGFCGKTSIKNVLPIMAPELDYASLTIRDGGIAAATWAKLTRMQESDADREVLSESLRRYCGLDSYAMYAIWHALNNAVNLGKWQ